MLVLPFFNEMVASDARSTAPAGVSFATTEDAKRGEVEEPLLIERRYLEMGIPSVTPQEAGYVVQHWGIEDGLPLDRLTSLAQTPDGFLWIGTDDQGLSRFDGKNFVNLNPLNERGLTGWRVSELMSDSHGRLWVRNGRDLAMRENDGFRLMLKDRGGPLTEDSRGNIVIQDFDGLMSLRFQGNEVEVTTSNKAPAAHSRPPVASVIRCDSWDRIWQIDKTQNRLYELTPPGPVAGDLPNAGGPPGSGTKAFVRLGDGRLGLLNESGLYVRTAEDWTLLRAYPPSLHRGVQPRIATCDSKGNLWIGTDDKQLILWRPDEGLRRVALPVPEPLTQPRQVLEDSDRNIWVASHFGLYRFRQATFRTEVLDTQAKLRVLDLTATPDGSLWFAAAGKMFRLAPGETRPGLVGESAIYRILTPGIDGSVYGTAADNTLLRLARDSRPASDQILWQAPSTIDALHESRFSGLWVATRDGLYRRVGDVFERSDFRDGNAGGIVVDIQEDGEGRLLVLHRSGELYRREGSRWEKLSPSRWNESDDAVGLTVTPPGTIWVAGRASALACYHRGQWREFGFAELELPQGAMGIGADRAGGLWWNTYGEGVFHLDPESVAGLAAGTIERALTIRFGLQDGLLSLAGDGYGDTPVRDHEGRIWVPTAVGASVVDPRVWRQESPRGHPPHIHLDAVALDGVDSPAPANPVQPITVPAGIDRIHFRCSLVELSAPDRAFFSYRLVNYDLDWNTVRTPREITYRKLPPGEYVFEAKAANQHLEWSAPRTLAALTVRPFWWQTEWFRLGLVVMLAGGAWLAYATRVRHFLRQQALQQDFSRRLIEAQERERKRIAADLHDGLGQNLLVIKNGATLALRSLDQPEKLRRRLEELSEISGEAVKEARAISHALRPMQLDELGLTNALNTMLRKIGETSALTLTSRIDPIDRLLPAPSEINLYRVVQECLSNVQKHARARAVKVEITVRGKTSIALRIVDDGAGFDPALGEKEGCMGLRGIRERVRNLNGTVEISSHPGAGTRVAIVIPCQKASAP